MSYLIKKAEDNYKIAKISVNEGCYDVAVSRYYYFVYQSLVKFLYNENVISPDSIGYNHNTTIDAFIGYCKITNNYEQNRGILKIGKLKNRRHESDYKDELRINDIGSFKNKFENDFNEVVLALQSLNVLRDEL